MRKRVDTPTSVTSLLVQVDYLNSQFTHHTVTWLRDNHYPLHWIGQSHSHMPSVMEARNMEQVSNQKQQYVIYMK